MSWKQRLFRRSTRRRFSLLRPWVVGHSVLDIGAAEGWLGEEAAAEGLAVQLVDVVDLNQTQLPFQLYDGRDLPFPAESFDTVMILLTLHHCADPEAVLAEAIRVARRRILITESVYRNEWGKRLLTFLDGGFNGLRSEGKMRPALGFREAREWEQTFQDRGLLIRHQAEQRRGLHRQHFFVLDKETSSCSFDGHLGEVPHGKVDGESKKTDGKGE
ncbi:MAG: class I SAM-dependent methyltransferase [Opitutales bacterium]|nr:class I SAM-dependent methyltransferase [Opitutales bacterium]MCH8539733.1 class I SAM-dependent methyltransferase [Opitutales bacterium]